MTGDAPTAGPVRDVDALNSTLTSPSKDGARLRFLLEG